MAEEEDMRRAIRPTSGSSPVAPRLGVDAHVAPSVPEETVSGG
jgi:hypothetical protein